MEITSKNILLSVFLVASLISAIEASNDWYLNGEISANYRGIGARPAEVEIENQLYISDIYFSFEKPVQQKVPFFMEFTTNISAEPILNQFHLNYARIERVNLIFGKFMIPFGRFNELYKPTHFLSITRPLPYASPSSLDYVARLNLPHPFMASGFADLGVKATWISKYAEKVWIPSQVDLFVANGMAENPLLGRSFPRSETLGTPSQEKGIQIDYGHEQTRLADNNDEKQWGGRVRFALGDLRLPFFSEGKSLRGAQMGFSFLTSKFDIDDKLDYNYSGLDFSFHYGRYAVAGEYLYGYDDYRIVYSTTQALARPSQEQLPKSREFLTGFYLSNSFRLPHGFYGKDTFAYLGVSNMTRLGKELEFDQPQNIVFQPEGSFRIKKWIYKYTLGVRSNISENFYFKVEYSFWNMAPGGFSSLDIYQWAVSSVVKF